MTMDDNGNRTDPNENFDSVDLSGALSEVNINSNIVDKHNDKAENLTADKLLEELPIPQGQQQQLQPQQQEQQEQGQQLEQQKQQQQQQLEQQPQPQSFTYNVLPSSMNRNNYDQFFEEVSLDLPGENDPASMNGSSSSKLRKFMPRRGTSLGKLTSNTRNSKHSLDNSNGNSNLSEDMTITASDFSGPFYSISDVLDDTVSVNANNGAISSSIGSSPANMSPTPGAARRNVNEADVVVTSGGVSMPIKKKSTLNPFRRSKSVNQKPSPLESVISKTRPRTLPPKDPQEEKKHLQEYESMMRQAKKLEAKKQKEHNRKKEERDKKVNHAIHIWENDIIPQWNIRVKEKRTMSLWDQGIPPRCRRKAWQLSIGNRLNVSRTTFAECTRRLPHALRTPKRKNNTASAANTSADDPPNGVSTPTTVDKYSGSPLYSVRRPRRTSSLNVLGGPKAESGSKGSSLDGSHVDDESENNSQYAGFTNFTNSSSNGEEANSSTYSFTSCDEPLEDDTEDDIHGGRAAMELEAPAHPDAEEDINLEDDTVEDDGNTVSSQEGIIGEHDNMVTDPTIINFLNKAIDEDILRTLPSLCVFQPDGPLFISLRKVLHAFVGYRHDLTYTRGASFLAGVLLLNMNTQESFSSLVNMINNSQVLSALYNSDEKKIQGFFKIFNVIFAENLPKLYLHFKNLALTPENYLPDWFMTVFASIIPLELSSRLWDIYLLHGDIILFRTGLVVLKLLEPLLWGGGFSETVKILNMGFVGEHRGEEVKAALAVTGHITEGEEDPFFDEILGRKGIHLDETRYNELLGAHMPRST